MTISTNQAMRPALIESVNTLNNLFIIKEVPFSVTNISANGGNSQQRILLDDESPSYIPVGVMGYTFSSGTRQNWLNVWKLCIEPEDSTLMTEDIYVRLSICNTHPSNTASVTGTIYVLYLYGEYYF